MLTTRRAVLTAGTLSGLAALVPSQLRAAGDFFAVPGNRSDGEWWMLRSVLEPQVGTAFGVRGGSPQLSFALPGSSSLQLDSIAGLAGQEDRDDSFSAQFSGPANQALPQGTYTFRHPTLGSFDAFLVPVGVPGKRQSYELIVNREIDSKRALGLAPKPGERAEAPAPPATPASAATPVTLDSVTLERSPSPVGRRLPKIGTLE